MSARYLSQPCAEAQPSGVVVAKVVSENASPNSTALVRDTAGLRSIRSSEKLTEWARFGLVVEVVVEVLEFIVGHCKFAIFWTEDSSGKLKAEYYNAKEQ